MPLVLAEEKLQELCREWQEVLRLQDWRITVAVKRQRDMPVEDKQATVTWNFQNRTATISLLDPIDYSPQSMTPLDQEDDLVHELIHLPFSQVEHKNETAAGLFEQGIEALATAYVSLKRRCVILKQVGRKDATAETLLERGMDALAKSEIR